MVAINQLQPSADKLLCREGRSYAHDLADYLCMVKGEVRSTTDCLSRKRPMRVEVPHTFAIAKSLLQVVNEDRGLYQLDRGATPLSCHAKMKDRPRTEERTKVREPRSTEEQRKMRDRRSTEEQTRTRDRRSKEKQTRMKDRPKTEEQSTIRDRPILSMTCERRIRYEIVTLRRGGREVMTTVRTGSEWYGR